MKQAQRMAEMCSEAQGVSWAEDVFPQGVVAGPAPARHCLMHPTHS